MKKEKFIWKLAGDWRVRVYKESDERESSTTWPIPVGQWWLDLRERLSSSVYSSKPLLVTSHEAMAIRDIINAYRFLLSSDVDKDRLGALRQAVLDALSRENNC